MPMECKKCGIPLEGYVYRWLIRFLGIKPSTVKLGLCNKCEAKDGGSDQAHRT